MAKARSKAVPGAAKVLWIKKLELHNRLKRVQFRSSWKSRIRGSSAFWRKTMRCSYWTIIGIGKVKKCSPFFITKRDRRGWVTLNNDYSWWPIDITLKILSE